MAGPAASGAPPLPEMAVVEVTGLDAGGEPTARLLDWGAAAGPAPPVRLRAPPPGQPAPAAGARLLARLARAADGRIEAQIFRRLPDAPAAAQLLGVAEAAPGGALRLLPTDRRAAGPWSVAAAQAGGARPGDLVLAETLPEAPLLGPRPARVLRVLGREDAPGAIALLCLHRHGIPDAMPPEAEAEAARAGPPDPAGREDLRGLPLVTIDGEDARDFDDAVWAEATPGGWRILVAIADVAHYVPPGSALDREARRRGTSAYLPGHVAPMLPTPLSEGWCSLRPGEDRACLFVEIALDAAGQRQGHRFGRGLMRSAARLTYEAAQAAREAGRDPEGAPPGLIAALHGACGALLAARARRGALDLAVPERRVVLDAAGRVRAVLPRPRWDSHRLVEEFMVAANACAAEELERRALPGLYRVHAPPAPERLAALGPVLAALGVPVRPGRGPQPRDLAGLLERLASHPEAGLLHEGVLRSLPLAAYSPANAGHFGLALPRYAHLTSPIRRYPDLVVHRAIIAGLGLGAGGALLPAAELAAIAADATGAERRAGAAEREAVERHLAALMATHAGESFDARISGVTRSGLFVTLDGNGASGWIPLASLPDDRWQLDEAGRRMTGRSTGLAFALGQVVEVQLAEASPRTGGLVFRLMAGAGGPRPRGSRSRVRMARRARG